MNTKTCFKCGETKPLVEFYRHPQMADGHLNKCKVCTKLDARRNYDAQHAQYQEYHAARRAMPEVKEQHKRGLIQSNQRYPEKRKARRTVQNAIRSGRIERKQCCEVCGSVDRVEAHHPDYSQPLHIQWLCTTCHGKAHRKPRIREVYS